MRAIKQGGCVSTGGTARKRQEWEAQRQEQNETAEKKIKEYEGSREQNQTVKYL